MENCNKECLAFTEKEVNAISCKADKKAIKSFRATPFSQETRIMRLNYKEINLIELIRNYGAERLVSELKSKIDDSTNIGLSSIVNALKDRNTIRINDLIETGFITKEDMNYLLNAIDDGENIIVTGGCASGKTTLVNALLEYQENKNIAISQINNEIVFSNGCEKLNDIKYFNSEKLTNKDISKIGGQDRNIFFFNELRYLEDYLNFFTALNVGCNVITTLAFKEFQHIDKLNESILNSFDDCFKAYAKETLEKNKFIIAHIELDNSSKRKCNLSKI